VFPILTLFILLQEKEKKGEEGKKLFFRLFLRGRKKKEGGKPLQSLQVPLPLLRKREEISKEGKKEGGRKGKGDAWKPCA